MKPIATIVDSISQNKQTLQSYGLLRIGLFGSAIRGDTTDTSDVDILLEFDPKQKTYKNFCKSTEYLESLIGEKIDVVTKEALHPYIRPYIERDIRYVKIAN